MPAFSLSKTVREVYDICDEKVRLRVAPLQDQISCKKNCWGCCTIFTGMTLPEGVAVASWLLEPPQAELLQQFKRALPNHLAFYKEVGYDIDAYFQKEMRCIFLSQAGACKAYEVRPLVCRAYYVTSDPKLCFDRTVVLVKQANTHEEKLFSMRQLQFLCREANIPVCLAPIPVAVNWGLYYVQKGREAWLEHFLNLPETNIMSVSFWRKAFESSARKEVEQKIDDMTLAKRYFEKTGKDPAGIPVAELRRAVEQP